MNNHKFEMKIERFLGLNISENGETEIKPGESPYMRNFKVTEGYKLKKRNGYSLLCSLPGEGRGIWCGEISGNRFLLCISGGSLFKAEKGRYDFVGSIPGVGSCSFIMFYGKLYILSGDGIRVYDGETLRSLVPYRPMAAIGSPPSGGGTPFEALNLLCGSMRQSFTPDGNSKEYRLLFCDITSVDYVKKNGEILTGGYTVSLHNGSVTFDTAPAEGIPDSIEIGYTKTSLDENSKINRCRYAMSFGGENDTRIFLWGNSVFPNTRFYSGIVGGMPSFEYFPADNFTLVGSGEIVNDIIRQYDRQLIFTDGGAYYSYLEMKTDSAGKSYSSFPIRTLSSAKGSVSKGFAKLIDNYPVTVMPDGIYKWVSTNIRDERNAVLISSRINAAFKKEDLKNARSFDHEKENELFIFFRDKIYIYNYNLDVFYYYDNVPAADFTESPSGEVYFITPSGEVMYFDTPQNDAGVSVDAEWHSMYMDFSFSGVKKNLDGIYIALKPDINNSVRIEWASDSSSRRQQNGFDINCRCSLFNFCSMDFGQFTFDTVYVTKMIKKRLSAKRFNFIKFILKSNTEGENAHILELKFTGTKTALK